MNRFEGRVAAVTDVSHEIGAAADKAWGIVHMASDPSRFMTGSKLVIDGRYTAH